MKHFFRSLFLLAIVLFVAITPILPALAQGTVLADTGFRPQTNGFAFANYGNTIEKGDGTTAPVVNLTPAAMQKVFGDRVCKAVTEAGCVLTATAQAWMDKTNNSMNGGHCEGMAALSKLIYTGQVKLSDLDPNATSIRDLKPDNPRVQEEIARWWATQSVPPTASQEIKDQSPNQIVDTLVANLKANTGPFTMGIYKPDGSGGHAITPYSVVDMGNGVVRVMVYDNNYPNEERFIEIDRNANTWKYTGSTNPNEPAAEYSGSAANLGSLTLTPATARTVQPQECIFCNPNDGGIGAAPRTGEEGGTAEENPAEGTTARGSFGGCGTSVSSGPEADLVVTDANGNSSGVVNGQTFSNIPDSVVVKTRSQGFADDTPGANIIVPGGGGVDISVNGAGGSDLFMASCGGFQHVLGAGGGGAYTLSLGDDAGDITLGLDAALLDLLIEGGYDNPDGNDFVYSLLVDAAAGGIINIDIDPETGEFSISSDQDINITPTFTNITPEGELVETTYDPINLGANQHLHVNGDAAAANNSPEFITDDADSAAFDEYTQSKGQNLAILNGAGITSGNNSSVVRWFYDDEGNYVEVLGDGSIIVTDSAGNASTYGPGEAVDANGNPLYDEDEIAPDGEESGSDSSSGDGEGGSDNGGSGSNDGSGNDSVSGDDSGGGDGDDGGDSVDG